MTAYAHRGLSALIIASVLLAAGCGKQGKAPDEVYTEFHRELLRAGRGDPAGLPRASRHLSSDSWETLRERAEAVNADLPEGAPKLDPGQMLSVAKLTHEAMPSEIRINADSPTKVTLMVTIAGQTESVAMVREGKDWKIDLFATPPSEADSSSEEKASSSSETSP